MESINRNRPNDAIQKQSDLSKLIGKTQESIASGKSFSRPSEAPSSWLEISSLGRKAAIESSWLNNIGRAGILAQQAESSIDIIASGTIRAKELVIQANNETLPNSKTCETSLISSPKLKTAMAENCSMPVTRLK